MAQKYNSNDKRHNLAQKTRDMLHVIHSKSISNPKEQQAFTDQVVEYWKEHINPGFLAYRKSVSSEYTSIEWADAEGGSVFYDLKGKEYIDCLGGFGIYNVGHRHPKVVGAVKAQLEKQALHSQELLDPLRTYLGHLLSLICPGDLKYSFLTNSGTESVEACLKMAMLSTGRKHFVAMTGGFHGKTLGALSATSKKVFRAPFMPLTNFSHVPFGDSQALEQLFDSCAFTGNLIAGVILEPIQGEGGIYIAPDGYLQKIRQLCDKHGALMILDEVQSGMGRCGKWFACEHWNVAPDLMALGKGLGGGVMPVGACVGTEKVWQKYFENPFLFTTTFGGNPLACAAAIAAINVIEEENLLTQAKEKGEYFKSKARQIIKNYPTVLSDVRGMGLMLGIEFPTDEIGYDVSKGLFARGVVIAGTLINSRVIRIEPPLTITYNELDKVLERLDASCAEVAKQLRSKPIKSSL